MKKKIFAVLCVCAALSLSACGNGQTNPIATEESNAASIANSTYEIVNSAADINKVLGFDVEAPADAENVCYSIVYDTKEVTEGDKTMTVRDDSKPLMAQVDFNIKLTRSYEENGETKTVDIHVPYTYRAKVAAKTGEPSDLSGLKMSDFGWTEDSTLAGKDKLKLVSDTKVADRAAKIYYGEELGNVYWQDSAPGFDYTLTVGCTVTDGDAGHEGAITLDEFMAVANSIFKSLQGES